MKAAPSVLKSFARSRTKLPALGTVAVAITAVFLLGSTPQTAHSNASLTGFTSFDASGAGTTADALQGTVAFGINASGAVVGIQTDSKGVHHGIVRAADGTITQFDAPLAGTFSNQGTLATGINTAGDVTGYYTDQQQAQHGYVRTANGTLTAFDIVAPSTDSSNRGTNAFAINDSGTITGQVYQYSGVAVGTTPTEHGFLRAADGTSTTFDAPNAGAQANTGTTPIAINASGVVAGYSGDSKRVFHGFIRSSDGTITIFDAPGAGTGGYQGTIATAIDAGGDITGVSIDSGGSAHGFLRLASGTVTVFNAPGAGTGMLQGTFPIGINKSGAIVGFDFDSNYVLHAFTRGADGTLGSFDAAGAGTTANTTGNLDSFHGTGAFGINDSGEIAGSYLDSNSVSHGFFLVAPSPAASFAVAGTAASVSRGASSGNTSTITVTPSGGFTGAVALTAAVTSSPAGAVDPPTLSFGTTTPVNVTGTTAGSATLTIATTAASTASVAHPLDIPRHRELRWYGAGSAVLACVFFFGLPRRNRGWIRLLSAMLFFAAIGGLVLGCGGSGGGSSAPITPTNPGTTVGSYTITVTGTSGATTSTGTVALTVQ